MSFFQSSNGAAAPAVSCGIPACGLLDCAALPSSVGVLGLADEPGLLLAFVPPDADFSRVSSALQRLGSSSRNVLALSSIGALCGRENMSAYCEMAGRQGSWLWLPQTLVARHEVRTVDLHVKDTATARQRVAGIRKELEAIDVTLLLSAEGTFALVFCDGLSASEGFLMQAWYECGRFPCLAIGGSAGGKLDFSGTFIGSRGAVLQGKAVLVFCQVAPRQVLRAVQEPQLPGFRPELARCRSRSGGTHGDLAVRCRWPAAAHHRRPGGPLPLPARRGRQRARRQDFRGEGGQGVFHPLRGGHPARPHCLLL